MSCRGGGNMRCRVPGAGCRVTLRAERQGLVLDRPDAMALTPRPGSGWEAIVVAMGHGPTTAPGAAARDGRDAARRGYMPTKQDAAGRRYAAASAARRRHACDPP